MAWAKLGSDTLTSSAEEIEVALSPSTTFLQFMLHKINTGGAVNPLLTFNSDSGSNYAYRFSTNGGTDSTLASQTKIEMTNAATTPTSFVMCYGINISSEEKLLIIQDVEETTAGAATAPARIENVSKWVNTSDQTDTVTFGDDAAGSYAIDSNVSVLGTD